MGYFYSIYFENILFLIPQYEVGSRFCCPFSSVEVEMAV